MPVGLPYPRTIKRTASLDIVDMLEEMAKYITNVRCQVAILASIKKYYDYLIEAGRRNDHPCRTLPIKQGRNSSIIHSDLFTSGELELLMKREERFADLKLRNQVLISLLIYQGLTSGEIIRMKV